MDIMNMVGTVIFTSALNTLKDVLIDAVSKNADLCGADLCGADLYGADLYGANLRGANLRGANLRGANLRGANLYGADLCGADLYGANLRGANLYGADLCGADLYGANLRGANLRGADLCGADLYGANLRGANLYGADLCGADLRGANLRGANLRGADNLAEAKGAEQALAQIQFIPETGSFEGWKKCRNGVIIKLLIPASAKRSHGSERKCRASKVKVLAVFNGEVGISGHDGKTEYRKGSTVEPDSFDENRWDVCSHGIHFFLTRVEAENYSL